MPLILWFCCLLLCVVNFDLRATPQTSNQSKVVQIALGEWPPYVSKDMKDAGLLGRIVTDALASEGYKVQIGYYPWARAYALVEHKEWDMTLPWFDTDERRNKFLFSEPLMDFTQVFFHRKDDNFQWSPQMRLPDKRIGMVKGYHYGGPFKQISQGVQIDLSIDEKTIFRKLLRQRIDAFATDFLFGYYFLHKHFASEASSLITNNPQVLYNAPGFVLIQHSKRGKELQQALNRGLLKLKQKKQIEHYIDQIRIGQWDPDHIKYSPDTD